MDRRSETRRYVANPADLPRGTLVRLFYEAVDCFGDAEAFRYKEAGEWHSISYNEVEERVRLAALALKTLGFGEGDHLAILSENRPEWALADYATLFARAIDVPVYPSLPADQVAYILNDSGARLVFVSTAEQLEKLREARRGAPSVERIVVFDDVPTGADDALTFAELLERGRREEREGRGGGVREQALRAEPDDVATVLYTSGTTGRPKGVMLTHDNVYSNVQAVNEVLAIDRDDVALSLLPLSHIFERMVDYKLFSSGCTIAYAESIQTVRENMPEVRPTIMVSVPRLYEKIYDAVQSTPGLRGRLVAWATRVGERWAEARLSGRKPGLGTRLKHFFADRLVFSKLRKQTGGRLDVFISGGAPLNAEIGKFFYAAGLLILEGYGLTETSPVMNVNRPDAFRFGTVGKPVPGTEEMIADDGEILVRGPQVMEGYYNMPEETRAAIDQDGWLHTGDIGALDRDGYLRITDRKKELIVTAGGKNIAPQPIENRVKTNRFVGEAVMLGDRRPYPILLVVPDFDVLEAWAAKQGIDAPDRGALVRDEAVREKMEQEVFGMVAEYARYERPKKIALLEREFSIERAEITPTLKVRRRVVEEHYAGVIESLYAESERAVAQ